MAKINLNELKSLITGCLGYDKEKIINNPNQWGNLTFEDIKSEIESLFDILQQLNNLPINLLPSDIVHQAAQHLQQVIDFLGKINEFNLQHEQQPPANIRTDYSARLAAAINNFQKTIIPYIPYLHSKALKVDDYQKEKEQIEQLKKSTSEVLEKIYERRAEIEHLLESSKNEIGNILESTKNLTAASGVSRHKNLFSEEATNNVKESYWWLLAVILLSSTCIATSLGSLLLPFFFPMLNDLEWWQILSSKIFVLALLLGLIFGCLRIYKAKLHQASVNKHRANALGTFDTFVNAATDQSIKDAVLMETTKAIFALSSSGYIKGEGDSAPDGAKIIEITRNIAQTAKAAH